MTAIEWIGHATALIELDGARFLTDPVLRRRLGPLVRIAPVMPPGSLTKVDAVLLSHLHADHTDPRSLRAVAAGVPVIAPRGSRSWLGRAGVGDVRELSAGGAMTIAGVRVEATPAVHSGRRAPFGPTAEPIGYMVRGRASVYFAGDSDLFPAMAKLAGSVDVALIPVWGWGPSVGAGHLDPERAARAMAMICPRVAIPIHWGTYALPWATRSPNAREQPARAFAELASRDAPGVKVCLLAPGERTEI